MLAFKVQLNFVLLDARYTMNAPTPSQCDFRHYNFLCWYASTCNGTLTLSMSGSTLPCSLTNGTQWLPSTWELDSRIFRPAKSQSLQCRHCGCLCTVHWVELIWLTVRNTCVTLFVVREIILGILCLITLSQSTCCAWHSLSSIHWNRTADTADSAASISMFSRSLWSSSLPQSVKSTVSWHPVSGHLHNNASWNSTWLAKSSQGWGCQASGTLCLTYNDKTCSFIVRL